MLCVFGCAACSMLAADSLWVSNSSWVVGTVFLGWSGSFWIMFMVILGSDYQPVELKTIGLEWLASVTVYSTYLAVVATWVVLSSILFQHYQRSSLQQDGSNKASILSSLVSLRSSCLMWLACVCCSILVTMHSKNSLEQFHN